MRRRCKFLVRLLVAVVAALGLARLGNASFWSSYRSPVRLLAHRGMAQTFDRAGLTSETCTATRIHRPEHPYLENTLASMQAAFAAGAERVELDIHPTRAGAFAVFHDWTVDCRTNGHGVTREHTLAALKQLDIGYGYTADGGKTHPFRGKGVGLMPSLDEVLAALADKRLLIHVKSNDPRDGERLADRLLALPQAQRQQLIVYGGDRPMAALRARIPSLRVMSRRSLVACATRYLAVGWSGHVPAACRNSLFLIPVNMGWLLWGWPNRFIERMDAAGTAVYVTGPYVASDPWASGIDTEEDAARVPAGYSGGIWTNRIDRMGPRFR